MNATAIRVLVVDDSAFARKVLREVLSSDPELDVVGIARDGLDALEQICALDPDVVTLDLVMPNLDGLGVLRALGGKQRPSCVVVSMSDEHSSLAIEALQAGAVDLVHKPTALATDRLYELAAEIMQKVKIAARARAVRPRDVPVTASAGVHASPPGRLAGQGLQIVVIGTSTGGPQALTRIVQELPRDLPVPVGIVLHIPIGYTAALAARLGASSAIRVLEAYDGLPLTPGMVVLARAGLHMKVVSLGDSARVVLDPSPVGAPHRPSVDALFISAARCFGPRVLGVVLTGMGDDGLEGARAICDAGGSVITEAESSCVVYGMPRAVNEAGLSVASVRLEEMTSAIVRAL